MFTRYDKAGAAVIGGALTAILGALTSLDAETLGAIGTLLTTALVWAIPNKVQE